MVVIYTHDAALIFSTDVTNMGTKEADNKEDIMTKDKEKKERKENNITLCTCSHTNKNTIILPSYALHFAHLSMYVLHINCHEAPITDK